MEFKNEIVNDYLHNNNLRIIKSDPNRPWGGWYIIDINNIENPQDSMHDKKILHVIPGTLLSLQYHGSPSHPGHKETWETCTKTRAVISKYSVVNLSQSDFDKCLNDLLIVDLEPGAKIFIGSGFLHALANPYTDDLFVIETRESQTPESPENRESNISRIYDQTNRGGIPSYPVELSQKIMNPNFIPHFLIKSGEIFDIFK